MANRYIDNKKFFAEMVKYVNDYNEKEAAGEPLPTMSDYIGESFLKIATNLAHKKNFAGYKYKDEMISDGYFDCIRYAHKFDENKTNNPFGYFTQICYYAFLRKINKEKKKLYDTFQILNNSELFGLLHTHMDADDRQIVDNLGYSEGARENMNAFIKDYEEKLEAKKLKIVDEEDSE